MSPKTALFFNVLPSDTSSSKCERCANGERSESRVTVLLCCNADGSDRQKLIVVGKLSRLREFPENDNLPVTYRRNSKAQTTVSLFTDWLVELDRKMAAQRRKVLLLLDRTGVHKVNPRLTSVDVLFFPLRCAKGSSAVQPLDVGVIAIFKTFYTPNNRTSFERRQN